MCTFKVHFIITFCFLFKIFDFVFSRIVATTNIQGKTIECSPPLLQSIEVEGVSVLLSHPVVSTIAESYIPMAQTSSGFEF